MPKIVFQTIVFNSRYFLEECLRSIIPFGKVVVTEGPVSFWQGRGYTTSNDGTNDVLRALLPPENVIHGQFSEKDEMMNAAIHLIPDDTDFVWMVDSDEILKKEDLQIIISMLGDYDSMSFKTNSFYGGFNYIITGFEEEFEFHRIQRWYPGARWATHRPPTINAPDGKPWREHRHLNHKATDALGLRIFHYSYVMARQMKEKNEYYETIWPGTVIPDYFKKVYIPWVTSNKADREAIEWLYQGVHNFVPERRGPTFTKRFEGQHPYWIAKNMQKLCDDFDFQLKQALWEMK